MLARISVPEDYSATQSRRWTALDRIIAEQIAEGEDQSENPTVKSIYESTIGLWQNFGDSIVGGNWQKPTPVSATAGELKLAVKLVHTISNTDFLSPQGSARVADNALAPANNPAIDAAISQIEEFRSRKDGWKGPNSLGPTERTIDDAKTFAEVVLADSMIEPPHIGLAADGEITFFWQNPKITIDLTIAGDGTYSYFAKLVAGPPFFEDAAPVSKNFSEEIFSLMRREA
ncbi:MAG: hypothetical protein ACREDD_07545 [Methylocella sp.]